MKALTWQESSVLAMLAQHPYIPVHNRKVALAVLGRRAARIASIIIGDVVTRQETPHASAQQFTDWARSLPPPKRKAKR